MNASNKTISNLIAGDIIKTHSEIGDSYWKIALPVTWTMLQAGVNTDTPGLKLFYGMWYGDDPLRHQAYGKIEELPGENEPFEFIGHISAISLNEFRKNAGWFKRTNKRSRRRVRFEF